MTAKTHFVILRRHLNMLTIRLQRTGTKNKPEFRVVLAESHRAASKKFLEVLGNYNPRTKNFGIKSEERLKYWVSKNISLSPTVKNLLIEKKFLEGSKVKAWQPKKKEASEAPAAPAVPAVVAEAAKPVEPAAEAPAASSDATS